MPTDFNKDKIWEKITKYCNYQERNHQEVRKKLYDLGVYRDKIEQYLSQLIEENYINEERFAQLFAGGKFRMKQWGKNKIAYALRQRKISEYCINKGLQAIDEINYTNTLKQICQKKWKSLHATASIVLRKQKTIQYLLQKGYEYELIEKIGADFWK